MFKSKNFMFKKTITQIVNSRKMNPIYKQIAVLDEDNNLIRYYDDYCDELIDMENGIFLALIYMEYNDLRNVKYLEHAQKYKDEFCEEFILTTHKNKRMIRIPADRCPRYKSPETFGVKIKKMGEYFEITYGMIYEAFYQIEFSRGYEDIEITYADELKIQEEYEKIPLKFIPFRYSDDEMDIYSKNNIINPIVEKLMYNSLKFRW